MSRAGIAEAGHSRGDHNHFWDGVRLTLVLLFCASRLLFGLSGYVSIVACSSVLFYPLVSICPLPLPTKLKGAEFGLLDARPRKQQANTACLTLWDRRNKAHAFAAAAVAAGGLVGGDDGSGGSVNEWEGNTYRFCSKREKKRWTPIYHGDDGGLPFFCFSLLGIRLARWLFLLGSLSCSLLSVPTLLVHLAVPREEI